MRRLLPLFAAIAFVSAPLSAQEETEAAPQPTAAMQGFLDEVAAGDTAAARARIARVESLSGDDDYLLDITPDDLIERLTTCAMDEYSSRGGAYFRVESTSWTCADGEALYVSFLGEKEPDNPYLSIVGIQDAELKAKAEAAPARPLAMPPPPPIAVSALSEEERAALEGRQRAIVAKQASLRDAFGRAVVDSDFELIKGMATDRTRVIYQTRDPFFKTDIVAKQGRGPAMLEDVVNLAINDMGRPAYANCKKDAGKYKPHQCNFTLPRQDRKLFMLFRFSGESLNSVQVYYVKREELIEMRRRAIEAGKIDG